MNRYLLAVAAVSLLISGCASYFSDEEQSVSGSADSYQRATFSSAQRQSPELGLQDYVKELVAEMAMNMRAVDAKGTIAVTNFVATAKDYAATSDLGFTLADAFMSELHQFGLTTLDYKVADFIRVTPNGDFVMTRDYLELKETVDADYVLVGTFSHQRNGVLVHARIVNLQSKAVLATGDSVIPNNQATIPTSYVNQIVR